MQSLKKILPLFLPWLIYQMLQSICYYGFIFVFAGISAFNPSWEMQALSYEEISHYVAIPATILSSLICIPFFIIRYKRNKETAGQEGRRIGIIEVILLLVLGIMLNISTSLVLNLIDANNLFPTYEDAMKVFEVNFYLTFILVGIIAPITEELLLRGLFYTELKRIVHPSIANIGQSLLFGLMHGNMLQGIYACLLGFLLGVVMENYKNIFAPILVHGAINLTSLFIPYFLDLSLLEEVQGIGLILMICIFVSGSILWFTRDHKVGKVR